MVGDGEVDLNDKRMKFSTTMMTNETFILEDLRWKGTWLR